MAFSSLILLLLSGVLALFGMIPLLGWINWVTIPMALITVVVGVMGLATDKDPQTHRARGRLAHLMAVVLGLAIGAVATLRWMMGGGIL